MRCLRFGEKVEIWVSAPFVRPRTIHIYFCVYIYRDMRICTCVSCMYIYKKIYIYIYLYYNMFFLGGHLVCLVVYSFVFLGEAGAVEAAQELSKLGAVFQRGER